MLAWIAGVVASAGLGRVKASVGPNKYAPPKSAIPNQAAIAAGQATRVGALRGGTSGLAGSEADYYVDPQGIGTVGYVRIAQDVTSARLPNAMSIAGDPGGDDTPTVLADVARGPFPGLSEKQGERLSNAQGGNTRTVNHGRQHVIASTLLTPGAVTPSPKEMAAARAAGAPQGDHDALLSYWGD